MHGTFSLAKSRAIMAVAALVCLAATLASPAAAQTTGNLNGLWDAVVVTNGVEIPFRYEIAVQGAQAQGFFFEGDRRVGSSAGSYASGELKIEYDHLNTVLEAHLEGAELVGAYRNNRANARPTPFRAKRFAPVKADADAPKVAGDWLMSQSPATFGASASALTGAKRLARNGVGRALARLLR